MAAQTTLEVFGPFEIPVKKMGKTKRIEDSHVVDFWDQPGQAELVMKQGCYVYALRAGKGYTPWYVGRASKTFKQESFQSHKTKKYNQLLFEGKKGTPVMFFVAQSGSRKKIPLPVLKEMEKQLIQMATIRNPLLLNIQNAKLPPWGIKGVVRGGKGQGSANAKVFRLMFGFA